MRTGAVWASRVVHLCMRSQCTCTRSSCPWYVHLRSPCACDRSWRAGLRQDCGPAMWVLQWRQPAWGPR